MHFKTVKTAALVSAACFVMLALAGGANAQVITKKIKYGPYTIPAGSGDPHDHMGMGAISNRIVQNVAKPCSGCTVIGMQAGVENTSGQTVNIDTGPMLHHTVLISQGKNDTTCGSTFFGERFFASGNERTAVDLTGSGRGYKVGSSERWNQIVDLMNWATTSKTVYVTVTYKYATGSDSTARGAARPLWLDVDGCGDSVFTIGEGVSHTVADISAGSTWNIIGMAGHLHDHSVDITASNLTTGSPICQSVASFGASGYVTPDGRKHISGMTQCAGSPLAVVRSGETVHIDAQYNVPAGHGMIDDAMGIMLAYYY